MQYTVELVASRCSEDRKVAFDLHRDWTCARARLWAEIVAKLFYFRQLPWHLIGIAHHNPILGRKAAVECLSMWSNPHAYGKEHRQSQRFLDPTFIGDNDQDVPLRPLVQRFAEGESLEGPGMGPLSRWLGRLSAIRVSERSVEGIHSLVTKIYKRAPAASLPYVSIELRMGDVMNTLLRSPTASWTLVMLSWG